MRVLPGELCLQGSFDFSPRAGLGAGLRGLAGCPLFG